MGLPLIRLVRGESGLLGLRKAQAQVCLGGGCGVGVACERFRRVGQVADGPAGRQSERRLLKPGDAVQPFGDSLEIAGIGF